VNLCEKLQHQYMNAAQAKERSLLTVNEYEKMMNKAGFE